MSQNSAQIQMLNLANMQQALDEIVFENIDTGHKWANAQQLLEKLYIESVEFFKLYVDSKDGEMPKANAYWALFMDIMAKLTYFITYTKEQQGEEQAALVAAYELAAKFLPNCQHDGCVEFFEEIGASYKQVSGQQLSNEAYSIAQTITHFHEAVKS